MKVSKYLFGFLLTAFTIKNPGHNFCAIKNTTTQNGEEISYTVFYSVAGIYVNAGTATFTNKLENFNGKPVYHIVGKGHSNFRYDWIFKVRDQYESYIDTATMQPLKFCRDVHEGNFTKKEIIVFNHSNNTAKTNEGVFKIPDCIQDVLSEIYSARNIDFNQLEQGDKIPFQLFLENAVNNLSIRYFGREEIKTKYGMFKAIKFKTLLIPGTVFKENEEMTVWVTDDRNHIPVRIESEILIGSIKIDLTGYKNLRYPLSSLEKR